MSSRITIGIVIVLILACGLGASFAVAADEVVWQNTRQVPEDLQLTGDAWTAARIGECNGGTCRCAADDFVLTEATRITKIVFYSVLFGDPVILGGDWYVFADGGSTPGALIAHGEVDMAREDSGWVHQSWGTIYRNTFEPTDLELPAGRYFVGFRSIMATEDAGKYSILSTRWANGQTAALWNFNVQPDGTVLDRWMLLQEFNQVPEQEWAFEVHGETGGCTREPEWVCDGDVDGNGAVNPVDSGLVQAAFCSAGECSDDALCQYDLDCNGAINPVDAGLVQSLFGLCNAPREVCP
jgi:hypothetical protein